MSFLDNLLGLQEVLRLTIAGEISGYYVDYRHVTPVQPSEVSRTLVTTVGLAYGALHFCVYGSELAHDDLFEEANRLSDVLASDAVEAAHILLPGEQLLDHRPTAPAVRWSAKILHRRRDGVLFVKSSMIKVGDDVLASEYLRFLVAAVLPGLSAGHFGDMASVLRAMNIYYRRTNDLTNPQSPSRAFYEALMSLDAQEQSHSGGSMSSSRERQEPPSLGNPPAPGTQAERRWCPRCGLGWTPKYFPPGAEMCIGCQQRQAEATASTDDQE